jgi:hypothetical protein
VQRTCVALSVLALACSSGEARTDAAIGDAAVDDAAIVSSDASDATAIDATSVPDAGPVDPRDRLLARYLSFLRATPTTPQSNGLRGADLGSVCDLWARLDLRRRRPTSR